MKFFLILTFLSTLFVVLNSFKIAFDNGNSMLRVESNKLHNGKPVDEPKPEQAIEAISDLGFKVVNIEDDKKQEGLSVLKAKSKQPEKIQVKPREPIEKIIRNIVNSNGKTSNLNYRHPNEPKVSNHKIQLDHAKYGSFDIYITNVNENVNSNDGQIGYEK